MKMYILALILAAVLPVAVAQEQTVPAVPVAQAQVAPCPSPAVVRKAAAAKKATPVAKARPWWQDLEKANLAVLLLVVFLLGIIVGRLFAPRQRQVVTPVVYVHPPPEQPRVVRP